MRNDNVLNTCFARGTHMLNVFRHLYTRSFIDNYPTTLFYIKNSNV